MHEDGRAGRVRRCRTPTWPPPWRGRERGSTRRGGCGPSTAAALPAAAARRGPGRPLPRSGADRGAAARARRPLGSATVAGRAVGPAATAARTGGSADAGRRAAGAGPGRALRRRCPVASRLDSTRWRPWWSRTQDQSRRIAATGGRFRLLVAAESAGALAGAEMGHDGLPWRADAHDAGAARAARAQPAAMGPPRRLRRADRADLRWRSAGSGCTRSRRPRCCGRSRGPGIALPSTRAWVLREVDHPAVPLLLEFKELYRVWTAHGWAWRAQWVRDGRFQPGVRAGRGGVGAVGDPRRRRAADPQGGAAGGGGRRRAGRSWWPTPASWSRGCSPRSPATTRLAAAGATGDLYATPGRGGVRRRPGQGEGGPARRDVRADRRRGGAGAGRAAGPVPDRLGVRGAGRPDGRGRWPGAVLARPDLPAGRGEADDRRAGAGPGPVHPQLRHPGHRRRVGAGAARRRCGPRLRGPRPELVFFQHDEVVVHAPRSRRTRWWMRCGRPASRRPGCSSARPRSGSRWRSPVVRCYADAD